MIARLTGLLAAKSPGNVIIDVGGVGYHAHIPLSSFYDLPVEGSPVTLHIHTHVREDAILLFGFLSEVEKGLFLALMGVSGVGPKLALNIISGLPAEALLDAITRGDEAKVATIPGVGKKTAARLVLELRDKLAVFGKTAGFASTPTSGPYTASKRVEAVSALLNLGYKKDVAEDAVKKAVAKLGEDSAIEPLIKEALKALARA